MKNIRKIFTLIMVLAMVLSLAVPAMAAEKETFNIVINHPDELTKHQYQAYQIFTGTLHTDANGNEVLSTINWGAGVEGDAVLAALKDASNQFADAKTAQNVADIISLHNTNTTLIDTFRHILGENLTNVFTESATNENGVYTWENMDAGYYLIKDEDGSLDGSGETATNYILQVVGNTNVNPKGGKVTHDKLIEDGGNRVEAADYSIGDSVKFVLRGTLPSNYKDFKKFSYKFVDILSAGLTFNNDVKVYLENAGGKLELEMGFEVNYANPSVSGATFTVDFADLKEITGRTIDQHTTIVVEYTATLNEGAVIGGNGNPNTSYIKFDNDPHNDGEGETPKDTVYAFTWELDVNKINGSNDVLKDAKFILYRQLGGTSQYAQVSEAGVLTGWTTDREEATTLISDENGKFIIKGLESDVYYLEETEAPAGYNLPEDPVITIDIIASVKETADGANGTKGVVESLQIKVDNHNYVDGDKVKGIVSMNVINNPGATLPETGGMGTTLFYVFGGLMVAAAVVLLITKKRMSTEA